MDIQTSFGTTKAIVHHRAPKRLVAGVLACGLIAAGLSTDCAIAAADGLDASPPAVIDADGFQTTDTSTFPLESTWPGTSSHPCCSR
jgi:hypothetical protein